MEWSGLARQHQTFPFQFERLATRAEVIHMCYPRQESASGCDSCGGCSIGTGLTLSSETRTQIAPHMWFWHVFSSEVLQRSTMFIALQNHTCALQRSAMCLGRRGCIPLLKERDRSGIWGYKHVAPPEQEPSMPMMTSSSKAVSIGVARKWFLACILARATLSAFNAQCSRGAPCL